MRPLLFICAAFICSLPLAALSAAAWAEGAALTVSGARAGAAPPVFVYKSYTPNYAAPPAPPPTYVDQSNGAYCREYSQVVHVAGAARETYGTACLQPDGTWRVVE